jgi:hypothetical protein
MSNKESIVEWLRRKSNQDLISIPGWLAGEIVDCIEANSPRSWQRLWDTQWMNIVNHDRAFESYSKEDAVHLAVKMTEERLRKNNEQT